MYDLTKRPEVVESEAVKLVGANKNNIIRKASTLLKDPAKYEMTRKVINPYGNGKASERIIDFLKALR